LAENVLQLRNELLSGEYRPGPYHSFTIFEPTRRLISAAPYRDRVVHHALCRVIEPLFERSFIYDSYANRVGKGMHRALDRCTYYARRHKYVLQCDIRLFFPSIDHEVLLQRLGRKITDSRVLDLCRLILESGSSPRQDALTYFPGDDLFAPLDRRRGLPIGNLTSQFWANAYLDPLDHGAKDDLGIPGYIRYVDDFLVFGDDKATLVVWRERLRERLDRLRLVLHPRKTAIFPVSEGIAFLGFRVYPGYRRLLAASKRRAVRRLERLAEDYAGGRATMAAVNRSVRAWIAHASHGNTVGLRRAVLGRIRFRAGGRRSGAGRVVEQQP
jgi:hypothetical protein